VWILFVKLNLKQQEIMEMQPRRSAGGTPVYYVSISEGHQVFLAQIKPLLDHQGHK